MPGKVVHTVRKDRRTLKMVSSTAPKVASQTDRTVTPGRQTVCSGSPRPLILQKPVHRDGLRLFRVCPMAQRLPPLSAVGETATRPPRGGGWVGLKVGVDQGC